MNEHNIKTTIISICSIIIATIAIFFAGFIAGIKYAERDVGSVTTDIQTLRDEITTLRDTNIELTAERERLINELAVSNGKLKSIADELRKCSEDVVSQSNEYSERIKNANGNVLEYNRIFTERILGLCDRMEESINRIAEECGVDYTKVE